MAHQKDDQVRNQNRPDNERQAGYGKPQHQRETAEQQGGRDRERNRNEEEE